ncbi:hypothetical protein DFH07DRAFT_766107 [Mycena maculata]|uniref:Uncharacterized protein n=1 Tax=Mycena maculata TaxID=230809 RepID=A0AAD7NWF7_9AGAR|nr:hypothetical protein DFH07DRAFT_766107 [Mycena maculata]
MALGGDETGGFGNATCCVFAELGLMSRRPKSNKAGTITSEKDSKTSSGWRTLREDPGRQHATLESECATEFLFMSSASSVGVSRCVQLRDSEERASKVVVAKTRGDDSATEGPANHNQTSLRLTRKEIEKGRKEGIQAKHVIYLTILQPTIQRGILMKNGPAEEILYTYGEVSLQNNARNNTGFIGHIGCRGPWVLRVLRSLSSAKIHIVQYQVSTQSLAQRNGASRERQIRFSQAN